MPSLDTFPNGQLAHFNRTRPCICCHGDLQIIDSVIHAGIKHMQELVNTEGNRMGRTGVGQTYIHWILFLDFFFIR